MDLHEALSRIAKFDPAGYKNIGHARDWYTDGNGHFAPIAWVADIPTLKARVVKPRLAKIFEPVEDTGALITFLKTQKVIPNPAASLHRPRTIETPDLRQSIELAKSYLPANFITQHQHIEALLSQQSDDYDTLIDECEIAIYG